jgi:ribosomal protein S18 acetylase RimI-like enzyme
VADGFVLPRFRRQGWGRALLEKAVIRSRSLGSRVLHVEVQEKNRVARRFLENEGFIPVRTHLELAAEIEEISGCGPDSILREPGFFRRGEEALLAEIQNEVFRGSWGFCPNSAEEIGYYLDLTGSRITEILRLDQGERPVGYFWAHLLRGRPGRARIHMFGILEQFQGRGWGRQLFCSGLSWLKKKEAHSVELTVDSENGPAFAFYRSLGFCTIKRRLWYEKRL